MSAPVNNQPPSFWLRLRAHRSRGERGASAVEFALIAPLFFMLVFGMFSGGLLYNEKSQVTYASREATRYGSTLPVGQKFTGAANADVASGCLVASSGGSNTGPLWACNVAKAAITAAGGDLNTAIPNRFICVAVVKENTTNTVLTDSASGNYSYMVGTTPTPAPPATCFDDGGSDLNRRVHVLVQRNGKLNAVLFSMNITLKSSGVGRSEIPPS
jgi:Flp pilus assembly protein TadG